MSERLPARLPEVTPRQVEVARLVAAGYTNEQIARELGISHDGAKYHVSELLGRLGLQRREEIAEWYAREHGGRWRRLRAAVGLPVAALVGSGAVAAAGAVIIVLALFAGGNEEVPAATRLESHSPGVFIEMLSLIPDREETRENVQIGDTARAREILEIDRPDGGDREQLGRYLMELLDHDVYWLAPMQPVFLGVGRNRLFMQEIAQNTHQALGFTYADVDQWIIAGVLAGNREPLYSFRGPVSPGSVADRLAACAECPPATTDDYLGWATYGWGDGEPLSPPLFDARGHGRYIAVADGGVLRSLHRDELEAMIESATGSGSLADDQDFRLAAQGAEWLGALMVAISGTTPDRALADEMVSLYGEDWERGIWRVEDTDALLVPYRVAALGPGYDAGGPFTAVVLVHDRAEQATENATRLEARLNSARLGRTMPPQGLPQGADRWGDLFHSVETEVDGRVLLATLRGYGHMIRREAPLWNEPLLLHE